MAAEARRLLRADWQARLERTTLGQVLISLLILLAAALVLTSNIPRSALQQDLNDGLGPVIRAAGLDQDWGVFAPDPRPDSIRLEARIRFADGTVRTWHLPSGNRVWGAYWAHRWDKLAEHTVSLENLEVLPGPLAAYIARQETEHGRRPVAVTLIRGLREIVPPGADRSSRWRESAFYQWTPAGSLTGG